MKKGLAEKITSGRLFLFLLLTVLIVIAAPAQQQSKNASERSYRRARTILDAGIQALGGMDNFRKIEDMSLVFRAQSYEIGQSANPSAPYFVREIEGVRVADFKGGKTYQESKTKFRGGDPYWGRQVLKSDAGFNLDLISNVAFPLAANAVAGGATRTMQRWFPHSFLISVSNRAASLRFLGDEIYEGKLNHVISFADAGGTQTALYFDAKTDLLTKVEILGDDSLLGDIVSEAIFSDYRDTSGIKIPFEVISKYAEETSYVQNITEIKINSRPNAELFEIPKGMKLGREVGFAAHPTITKLAAAVYFVNGISGGDIWFYSQMFVVFKDYILVVESPLSDGVSQAVIAKIKETIPGKPIKYIVPTHYHTDHLGGVRGYIAEGAAVITTPGNQNFIEKISITPHTIRPDTLSSKQIKPTIETFTRKKVISDGRQTVELYNLGDSPHVDEMVLVYLPKEKILFVSDLMMTRLQGKFPPINDTNVYFAKKIKELNLTVERIANAHGWTGTMDDFLKTSAAK